MTADHALSIRWGRALAEGRVLMGRLPCQWPDGGCGAEVELFPTGKTKPDGKPVLQVVDVTPEKRIILEPTSYAGQAHQPLSPSGTRVARVVDTYVDHRSTCAKWLALVERERAAKAGAS